MRINELAKELGTSSKELLAACREAGFDVTNHAQTATPEIQAAMRKRFGAAGPPAEDASAEAKAETETVEKPAPKPAPERVVVAPRPRPVSPRTRKKTTRAAVDRQRERAAREAEAEAARRAEEEKQAAAEAEEEKARQAAAAEEEKKREAEKAPEIRPIPRPIPRGKKPAEEDREEARRRAEEEKARKEAELLEKRKAEERARKEAEEKARRDMAMLERRKVEERARKEREKNARARPVKPKPKARAKTPAKPKAKPRAESRPVAPPPMAPESNLTPEEREEAARAAQEAIRKVDHHVHRHKRADFRHRLRENILPVEPTISSRYDSELGGGRRRPGRRRGKRKKPNAAMMAARAAKAVSGQQQTQRDGPSKTSLRKREVTPDHVVELTPPVTLRELSSALGVKLESLIRSLMNQGMMANINDILPDETVEMLALEHDKEVQFLRGKDLEQELEEEFAEEEFDEQKLVPRPPVIAFLGHVDHGKTSLLDHIRKSRVVDTESGGITQHIGAYRLPTEQGMLCFLDTPGHEAFSTMRARGANLTDIVVLVCAADDGVMPQTKEAYAHARAAGVPVVVAVNKCDLPNANPQKARQELSGIDDDLLPEEWGGKIGMIDCSAATGEGIDELLERISLEAELLELRADPDRPAEGHCLEAEVTTDRGILANVLIQSGTLRRGDVILCGPGYGKVKLMFDENGKALEEAGPSTPVSVSGLNELPEASDRFYVLEDLQKAREIAGKRLAQQRHDRLHSRRVVSLDNLTEYLQSTEIKELRVVLKADVAGTLEVLRKTMGELATEEVKVNVIHSGVGGVTQADVILAEASEAIVVGFHVASDPEARSYAADHGVEIKIYHVIYHMVEVLKAALSGLLPPERREVVQGHAEVRQLFKVSRLGNIAGSWVRDGIITRTSNIRLFRDNVMIYEGKLASLQRFKDQVREVREGFECGLRIENYDNIQVGDVLEAYTTEEIARSLE